MKEYNDIIYYNEHSDSIISLNRELRLTSEEDTRAFIEFLVCRVRYYLRQPIFQKTYEKKPMENARGRMVTRNIESYTILDEKLYDEVVDLIWWVADHFPRGGGFPYRIDVIKNQLHLALGLENGYS